MNVNVPLCAGWLMYMYMYVSRRLFPPPTAPDTVRMYVPDLNLKSYLHRRYTVEHIINVMMNMLENMVVFFNISFLIV